VAEDQTCGEGLAEHAALPAKLAELMAAVAETLELHMKALDRTDESSEKEHRVYVQLAQEHHRIAALLKATADEMAGYRDLPMGRHDPEAMAAPAVGEAFGRLVKVEEELVTLLQDRVTQDRKLLAEMDP
jgi:hypothetical protein